MPGHVKIQLGIRIIDISIYILKSIVTQNQIFDSILPEITFRQSVASYNFFRPSVFLAKSLFGKVVFGEVSRILCDDMLLLALSKYELDTKENSLNVQGLYKILKRLVRYQHFSCVFFFHVAFSIKVNLIVSHRFH